MQQLALNSAEWESLTGETLDSKYRLDAVLMASRGQATFRASRENDTDVFVMMIDSASGNPDQQRRRFLEASFLQHPNLLRVMAVAKTALRDRTFLYAVLEGADTNLAAAPESLSTDEVRHIFLDVAGGLKSLHSENLVYCALSPSTIWRAGGTWKLGDFSQLRIAGQTDRNETRALVTRDPSVPPEAFEGAVTPAWDAWSLGWVLRNVIGTSPSRGPFDALIAGCLQPNPSDRWPLDRVVEELKNARDGAVAPQPGASAAEVERIEEKAARSASEPERAWLRPFVAFLFAVLLICCIGLVILFVRQRNAAIPGIPKASAHAAIAGSATPPEATGSADRSTERARAAQPGSANDIHHFLDRWAGSIRTRDVRQQLACYAPVVEQFYCAHNVGSRELAREKQRQFDQAGVIRKFQIANVRVRETSPDRAVVTFDKTWDFGTNARFAGSEQSHLVLKKIQGEWRISSERELKVYWVRHGKAPATG